MKTEAALTALRSTIETLQQNKFLGSYAGKRLLERVDQLGRQVTTKEHALNDIKIFLAQLKKDGLAGSYAQSRLLDRIDELKREKDG